MKHPKCKLCGKEHRLGPCPEFAATNTDCRECVKKAARITELEAQIAEMVEAKRAAKREAMRAYRKRKKERAG